MLTECATPHNSVHISQGTEHYKVGITFKFCFVLFLVHLC